MAARRGHPAPGARGLAMRLLRDDDDNSVAPRATMWCGDDKPGASPDVPVASARPWLGPAARSVAAPRWGCPPRARPTAPRTAPGAGCEAAELGAAAPPSARLETRTKESMELACWQVPLHTRDRSLESIIGLSQSLRRKPRTGGGVAAGLPCRPDPPSERCVVKATQASLPRRGCGGPLRGPRRAPRRGHRSRRPADRVLSACEVHGTRKVVNYTILRRSLGKPRWRAVAVLTCKLCSLSVA